MNRIRKAAPWVLPLVAAAALAACGSGAPSPSVHGTPSRAVHGAELDSACTAYLKARGGFNGVWAHALKSTRAAEAGPCAGQPASAFRSAANAAYKEWESANG